LSKKIGFNTAFSPLDMMPPRPAVIAHGKVLRVVLELRTELPCPCTRFIRLS
jgi:hypothetical protein